MTERLAFLPGDLSVEYQKFKEKAGFVNALGIIGGSSVENLYVSKNILIAGCQAIRNQIGNFAIVSGGTKGGVPEMALDVGRELGLPTIGVFPQDTVVHAAVEKLDFAVAVPSQPLSQVTWGTETPVLTSIPDAFVLVGGEWGSLSEVSMIMKRNNSLIRHSLSPMPIIGIAGSGKLADNLENIIQAISPVSGVYFRTSDFEELAKAVIWAFQ